MLESLKDIEFKSEVQNDPYTNEEVDLPESLPQGWDTDEGMFDILR